MSFWNYFLSSRLDKDTGIDLFKLIGGLTVKVEALGIRSALLLFWMNN